MAWFSERAYGRLVGPEAGNRNQQQSAKKKSKSSKKLDIGDAIAGKSKVTQSWATVRTYRWPTFEPELRGALMI